MSKKKIVFFTVVSIFLSVMVYFFTPTVYNRWIFSQAAEAVGGMPWQFGGTVTYYQPGCVPVLGICGSCPMCTALAGGNCGLYQEVQFMPATGSMGTVVCVPKGFIFLGGVPVPTGQILGGGASPILPWVIAVSSL